LPELTTLLPRPGPRPVPSLGLCAGEGATLPWNICLGGGELEGKVRVIVSTTLEVFIEDMI